MRKKRNKGAFRKGFDPRRHKFTREEAALGYRRAVEKLEVAGRPTAWLFWDHKRQLRERNKRMQAEL